MIAMEIDRAFSESVDNIMNFAEILYKCTLCTSLPSIMTSKTSFVSHVKGQHFNRNLKSCSECSLTFETEEDLNAHSRMSHRAERSPREEGRSSPPGTKVRGFQERSSSKKLAYSPQEMEADTFECCVNLIDGNGKCEKNPHLDLSNRESMQNDIINRSSVFPGEKPLNCMFKPKGPSMPEVVESSPQPENRPKVNIEYGLESSIRQHPCTNNLTRIHAVADQILAVNSTRYKPTGNDMIFSPGYTPEFGKFTKLVREGGNIVYFCQVCNWKSQIKSHFQAHCQGKAHKEKLKCAEEQRDENSPSPTPKKETSGMEKNCDSRRESPVNLSTSAANNPVKTGSPLRMISEKNKLERQNKRKRSVPISLRNQSSDRDGWQSSDSDSDSLDFNRSRPFHSVRTPGKKRYSKENKPSPNSEIVPKLDNSHKSVLQFTSDSDSNHLEVKQMPGKHSFPVSFPEHKKYPEEDLNKFNYGLFNQIHNQILWNLSNRASDSGPNTPDSMHQPLLDSYRYTNSCSFPSPHHQVSPPRGPSLYPGPVKSDSEYMYRCSLCSFGCNKIQEYKTHFESQHEQGNSGNDQGSMLGNEGKELWKVNKIKEYITGNVLVM